MQTPLRAGGKKVRYNIPEGYAYFDDVTGLNKYYYLADWLGTVRAVVDKRLNIVTAHDHFPFGKLMPGRVYESDPEGRKYQFTGHEFDEFTQYGYHGARYYDRDLGRYIAVDPLAHEREWLSPYNYCSLNPINRTDPTGELDDEWEINTEGKEVNRIENKTEDSFHVVDDKGERIEGKSIKFEYGTITDVNNPQVIVKGNPTTLTLFNVKGDENAKNLFEFFADPGNTKVEWSHARIGAEESGKNIVGSSHQKSSTAAAAYLRQTGYTLKGVNHNHPSGGYFPSKGDKDGAVLYKMGDSNIKLHIYTHPNRYSEYDEKGTLDFSDFGPAIEIFGTK